MNEVVFAAVRVSTPSQSLERQIRNIIKIYPNSIIIKEVYSGRKVKELYNFNKMYDMAVSESKKGRKVKIVFDSASRMSRDSSSAMVLYQNLYENGVELEFLKEPYINTNVYKKALEISIPMTDTNVDIILQAIKKYLMEVAREQIKICFDQAEKEVEDLRVRTREGLLSAKLSGKHLGRRKNQRYISKKEKRCKDLILRNSKDFNGKNSDVEVIKISNISKNTYYKYKKELRNHRIENNLRENINSS